MFNVKEILAEVFMVDSNEIPDNVKIGELSGWDSLGHMRLVLHIEKIIKRSVETEEILKMVNVQNINAILNNNRTNQEVETND